jgi:predicted phosphodiesterase
VLGLEFTVEHPHRNVHVVKFKEVNIPSGDEIARVLLRSDAHHDSRQCNRGLELEHLEKAKEAGAAILDCGDVFDVMQSRYDPRREFGGKRPEHEALDYIDLVVKDAADDYAPFAPNWVMMGRGNHETQLRRQIGTDITERLVSKMRELSDEPTSLHSGGYGGWVRFHFTVAGTQISKLLHYYHGKSGNAPVTKGAIQTQRMSRQQPDAHICWTGHTHQAGLWPWDRWRVKRTNRTYKDIQWHVCTPGYKDQLGDGFAGLAVERCNNEPLAIGAAWLKFYWDRRNKDIKIKPELDIEHMT